MIIRLIVIYIAIITHLHAEEFVDGITGNASVNQGAFNYDIPLNIPKGINGHAPKLGINYNSQAGNGYLGVGFSLQGLSSISRCAKTIATDGIKGRINFNNNDRACLDGQRLIVVGGKYWQADSEYKTEINNHSKITFDGSAWSVQNKAGQTLRYGATQDSKFEAGGTNHIREWKLNSISDISNNTINYTYNEHISTGENYIKEVKYADANIVFNYETRKDTQQLIFKNSKLQINKRLKNIQIFIKNILVNTYTVVYTNEKTSKIAQILQNKSGKNLKPLVFGWDKMSIGVKGRSGKWSKDNRYFRVLSYNRPGDLRTFYPISAHDINNDGLTDIVINAQKDVYTTISNAESLSSYHRKNCFYTDHSELYYPLSCTYGDVDGDGKTDYIVNTGSIVVNGRVLYTGNLILHKVGDLPKVSKIHTVNYNNDGLDDIFVDAVRGSDFVLVSRSNFATPFKINCPNGSCLKQNKNEVYNFANTNIEPVKASSTRCGYEGEYGFLGHHKCVYGDVNGDGALDWIENNGFNLNVRLGSFKKVEIITHISTYNQNITLNYHPHNTNNLNKPSVVINSMSVQTPARNENKTHYEYSSNTYDLDGRGNLGFSQITSYNEQTKTKNIINYHTSFPLTGKIKTQHTYLIHNNSNVLLHSAENNYDNIKHSLGSECLVDVEETASIIPYYRGLPVGSYDDFRHGWSSARYLFNANGNVSPIAHNPNYGLSYTSHIDRIIDTGPSPYGSQLQIKINTNFQSTNANSSSNGWFINVWTSE
jgi:hypothetical protein